jgi:hypothetical protein
MGVTSQPQLKHGLSRAIPMPLSAKIDSKLSPYPLSRREPTVSYADFFFLDLTGDCIQDANQRADSKAIRLSGGGSGWLQRIRGVAGFMGQSGGQPWARTTSRQRVMIYCRFTLHASLRQPFDQWHESNASKGYIAARRRQQALS